MERPQQRRGLGTRAGVAGLHHSPGRQRPSLSFPAGPVFGRGEVVAGWQTHPKKQILGIYTAESESARFWLTVLTDLKQRGVEDLLITCVDGLKGFDTAINGVFPQATVQLCIVHQLRNRSGDPVVPLHS